MVLAAAPRVIGHLPGLVGRGPSLDRPACPLGIDFVLPTELEAHEPPEARGLARDEVRLLVTYRDDDRVVDATFRDLPAFVSPGDLVVVNDSGTLAAALTATRGDGSQFALHLSTLLPTGAWVVEPRKTAVRPDEEVQLPGGGRARFLAPYQNSSRLWVSCLTPPVLSGAQRSTAPVEGPTRVADYLAEHGRPIRYPYVPDAWPIEAYQTAYARRPGSAEMPSAGRAFSERVLAALAESGVGVAAVTLHAGVASLESHEAPYEEWFEVPATTAHAIAQTRARSGRVLAVGTTVVRALESAVDGAGVVHAGRGWTDLVITPQRPVRSVDALLTGFHEPKASHLAMLEAIAGRPHLESAYAAALEGRYLWHEFGDLHLIL